MKTLLIFTFAILMTTALFADEKITKVAKNNVEYKETKIMQDKNDVEFEVWKEPESYGQDRIDEELTAANEALANAQAFDAAAYKQGLIDNAQAFIDKLNNIQAEMNTAVIEKVK